ncbi:ABC transporter family substrate-binding protein [Streptomyces sp. SAJ15]|uniref:ABC transporter family substrate-binding protein n=1 Tax=Streptomyces sp. SAJ15 TaxID=2011095 RepID=UPI00118649D3|nr:ABC transporter family substrate-binding protein [Streptomyces sp. SAJ15]TVL93948.1 hypothetical protein CD790_02715 [Streptomyces sp. SAJ15]
MSIDKRRGVALLAAGVLLPLPVLTGCGSDGDSGSTAGAQDLATAPRAQVRQGGALRWALDAPPSTFNAFQADADAGTERIAGAVLPALFTLDPRGRPRRNADYLRSAEVVRRQPRQVVVYELDPDAVWSDGRPIGTEDFAAQWKALRGTDNAYWTARNAGYDRIAKIESEGKRQVKVTFAKPYADWRALFTPLYPRSVMGDPDAFNDAAREGLPVGAGPFAMRRPPTGDHRSVTLVRNPRWWARPARLDRLVFRAVPRDQRAAALAAGDLDLAGVDPAAAGVVRRAGRPLSDGERSAAALRAWVGRYGPPDARAEYRRELAERGTLRRLTVRTALEPAYTQLALNGASGPLADDRVRRAVARAIDRGALAEAALAPHGLPARPLGSHLLMTAQQGYQDNSDAVGVRDAQAAQALLAEAGWRPGGRAGHRRNGTLQAHSDGRGGEADARGGTSPTLMRKGRPLSLRFVLPSGPGSAQLRATGEGIARMLDGIGVRTEITTVADDSYFRDYIASGDFDLALYSWPATAFPATDARPVFAKPQAAADGSLVVEQNYSRVGTDQIDQLFDQAVAELDADAGRTLVTRADARIWAAAGSIPLYQRPELVAVRKDVVNAGAFGFATPRYQDIGFRTPATSRR